MSNQPNDGTVLYTGCELCQGYVPEGRQICKACEDASLLSRMDKTPEGVIRKYRPAIVRAAKAQPAKVADQQAVYELGRIGLPYILARLAESEDITSGSRQLLIQAIADTRVLVERLAVLHCSSAQEADAYRFYLEQAARQSDPGRVKR